jgi:hypothetical protein
MHPDYADGYYAGLVNDRECPHPVWSVAAWLMWHAGNDAGLRWHCAVVEVVYLKHLED